jgi:hypothetical protein
MAIAKIAGGLRRFGRLFHRVILGVCPGMA